LQIDHLAGRKACAGHPSSTHSVFPPFVIGKFGAAHLAAIGELPTTRKGSTMTSQFLRHEAARFRGMAEDADRPATKERFLAMAADYEARANITHESEEPNMSEEDSESVEPAPDEAAKITLGRKIATGLKETVVVQRRPIGRPRRE
jgi:hypothetical protein